MGSIQRRISLALLVSLLLAGGLLAQGSLLLFDHGLRDYLARDLRSDAENLLRALVRPPEGIGLQTQLVDPSFQRPYAGRYFLIESAGQLLRSRSLWDHPLPMPVADGLQSSLERGPQAQQLLVYCGSFRRLGQPVRICVAQDYNPLLHSFTRVQQFTWALGAVLLLLLLFGQRWAVRSALRPLEQVCWQLVQLEDGKRTQLDLVTVRELRPLVEQINQLLRHTEATLQRSRNALGNLGHALKTPLAVLFTLLRSDALKGQPELRQQLAQQLQQMQERLSRELGRARLAGDVLPGAHFNCAQEIPPLLETLRLIHPRPLQLEWQGASDLRLPVDREDMLELLGNLLDNACKWAATQVRLGIAGEPEAYVVQVEDDGPGIDADGREQVLQRGQRLDEGVAGHGLGLAIVRDIADSWGAVLRLEQSELGGLCVRLEVPRGSQNRK